MSRPQARHPTHHHDPSAPRRPLTRPIDRVRQRRFAPKADSPKPHDSPPGTVIRRPPPRAKVLPRHLLSYDLAHNTHTQTGAPIRYARQAKSGTRADDPLPPLVVPVKQLNLSRSTAERGAQCPTLAPYEFERATRGDPAD